MLRSFFTKKITRARLEEFLARQASDRRTLDIGCSARAPYAKYFPDRVGVDIVAGAGVDIVADAHALPFPDGAFDVILCSEVLEHLHTPAQALSEMRRVLKRGGTLILTTRFIFPIHDAPHDYYRFTKYGLRHLLEHWEILEFQEEANTAETMAVLLQRIGFQTELRFNVLTKAFLFFMAWIIPPLIFLIRKEYGDIKKTVSEKNILSSGYYVVCKKI
jgi:SAM-dependent methyltransferase